MSINALQVSALALQAMVRQLISYIAEIIKHTNTYSYVLVLKHVAIPIQTVGGVGNKCIVNTHEPIHAASVDPAHYCKEIGQTNGRPCDTISSIRA
jgi:hypothetical protein